MRLKHAEDLQEIDFITPYSQPGERRDDSEKNRIQTVMRPSDSEARSQQSPDPNHLDYARLSLRLGVDSNAGEEKIHELRAESIKRFKKLRREKTEAWLQVRKGCFKELSRFRNGRPSDNDPSSLWRTKQGVHRRHNSYNPTSPLRRLSKAPDRFRKPWLSSRVHYQPEPLIRRRLSYERPLGRRSTRVNSLPTTKTYQALRGPY